MSIPELCIRFAIGGAVVSTFALQTLGLPAIADGTDIYINDVTLKVAPACSGIGMLLIFFALSTAIVLVIQRPLMDKLIILLSSIPIAILANIVRINASGRGRLPVCVVRMRSVLRCIQMLPWNARAWRL